MIQLIEARALHALHESGVKDIEVRVVEHHGTMRVILGAPVEPGAFDALRAALGVAYPDLRFDIILP